MADHDDDRAAVRRQMLISFARRFKYLSPEQTEKLFDAFVSAGNLDVNLDTGKAVLIGSNRNVH
jgi:hypothetical protein